MHTLLYWRRRILAEWRVRRAFRNPEIEPPVLVYTMGKVGSTSVYRALKSTEVGPRTLFVHFLSDDLPAHEATLRDAGENPLPYHIAVSRALQRQLVQRPDACIRVVSLVRDPIALVVSDLFQNPGLYPDACIPGTLTIDPHRAVLLLNARLQSPATFQYVNQWFEREINSVFGIDVFAEPFNQQSGFQEYRNGSVALLILRLEDLPDQGPRAIESFMELKAPPILDVHNTRCQTEDANAYARVKASVKLNLEACQLAYSGQLAYHFYSQQQITEMIKRWS